ncbi:MAG TPA: hypothetical protein VK550_12225 [Polyangiaceae bacterium]|nr:hypothetical protein [Polyangiaceae bacterium]
MSQPTSDSSRAKLLRLVGDGVSMAAAARAAGMSPRTARRVVTAAEGASEPRQPYTGGPQAPADMPPMALMVDQPRPPPATFTFDPRYHGHTFQSFSAPVAFDGWTLKRARDAVSMHRQGYFLESSSLAIVLLSFAPVLAATGQRLSPALALPRKVKCGTRGLSRILGEKVEKQIAPSAGLLPSPYFPPTLWGSTGFDLAFMGFSVWQHAYGDPDPESGVRMCYTRRWPSWAASYYRYRRQFVAMTSEGPIDIVSGDGKWTIIADSEEPHFMGAIVALHEEVLAGIFDKRALSSYIDKYGNPKWIAEMPPGTGVRTPEGDAAFEAIATIRGPDGFGVVPNGMKVNLEGLTAGASTVVKDALDSHWQYIAAALLGSDGTMTRGTGVYSSPIFAGVARNLVDRDLRAVVRGANAGHIAPWLAFNYAASIEGAAGWIDPVLDIPLPDPDADARIKSYSERVKSFHEIIEQESKWFVLTGERVEQLAKSLEIEPPVLNLRRVDAGGLLLTPSAMESVVTVNEARDSQGLKPLLLSDGTPDPDGALTIPEFKAKREAAAAVTGGAEGKDEAQDDFGAAETSSKEGGEGGSTTAGEENGAAAASPG